MTRITHGDTATLKYTVQVKSFHRDLKLVISKTHERQTSCVVNKYLHLLQIDEKIELMRISIKLRHTLHNVSVVSV